MFSVQYGDKTIRYTVQDSPEGRAHYISVSREEGVVLKGPALAQPQAERLVLKKARWILAKLHLVRAVPGETIVTGSRIAYLGKHYYTEVIFDATVASAQVDFNHSRFRIRVNPALDIQQAIRQELDVFFRRKADEKLPHRVRHWATKTGLNYRDVKLRRMRKRWGGCTPSNVLILNPDLIKLPYTLIDYVIMHELCHTRVKDHSKEFWAELARHFPNWRALDERMRRGFF